MFKHVLSDHYIERTVGERLRGEILAAVTVNRVNRAERQLRVELRCDISWRFQTQTPARPVVPRSDGDDSWMASVRQFGFSVCRTCITALSRGTDRQWLQSRKSRNQLFSATKTTSLSQIGQWPEKEKTGSVMAVCRKIRRQPRLQCDVKARSVQSWAPPRTSSKSRKTQNHRSHKMRSFPSGSARFRSSPG